MALVMCMFYILWDGKQNKTLWNAMIMNMVDDRAIVLSS